MEIIYRRRGEEEGEFWSRRDQIYLIPLCNIL